jgi:hypothetical protein
MQGAFKVIVSDKHKEFWANTIDSPSLLSNLLAQSRTLLYYHHFCNLSRPNSMRLFLYSESCVWVANTPALHLGEPDFKNQFWPGD